MRRKCDSRIDPNWPEIGKNGNDVTIFRHDVIAKFFGVVLFLLSCLVIGPIFISISSLNLEL